MPWNSEETLSCEFVLQCPRTWEQFTSTDHPNIRHCCSCDRAVHLVTTEEDFRRHADGGHCVAVRVLREREDNSRLYVGQIRTPYGPDFERS